MIYIKNRAIVFVALLSVLATSCMKDAMLDIRTPEIEMTKEDAHVEFAKILSKAVANNEELRDFIKAVALEKFDKDYDVFYPYAKDKVLSSGLTFREELLKYTSEDVMVSIENTLPLLNILVPDWEWIGAFSVNSWDTSDLDIVVSPAISAEDKNTLYYNGDYCCDLPKGSFPEYPVLIVKENERMKVVGPETRSADCLYTFASNVFDPNYIETKVEVQPSIVNLESNPGSNYVNAADFEEAFPEVVAAWNEYGADAYNAQRNMIYFGLEKGEDVGQLNPKVRESIYAIRLYDKLCMDDPKGASNDESHDAIIGNKTLYNSDVLNEEELLNTLWSDGQLEIQLYATTLDENGNLYVLNENKIPIHGQEIFDLTEVRRDFYHKTLFTRRRFEYYVDLANLQPKWYKLPTPLAFKKWDPSIMSSVIDIKAYEYDKSDEIEIVDSLVTRRGVNVEAQIGDKVKLSFNSNATNEIQTMKYKICTGSDDLGSIELQYDDFVIKNKVNDKFELKYYSTGKLDAILIPSIY